MHLHMAQIRYVEAFAITTTWMYKHMQAIKTFSMRKLVMYIGLEGNSGVKRKETRA